MSERGDCRQPLLTGGIGKEEADVISSDKAEGGGPLGALFRNWYEDILALRCASDTNANATKVSENWLRPSARFYPFQG